jgi:hypothetical protein
MVVAFTPGTCGINGWAVFSLKGGVWQLVGSPHVGWTIALAAVGSDIRETAPIPTGKLQCPTSGKPRVRIWHLNGSRLAASAWKTTGAGSSPPPQSPVGIVTTRIKGISSGWFQTPSGNIECYFSYWKGGSAVTCGIKSGLKPPPPSRGPGCTVSNRVSLGLTGRPVTGRSTCPGEDEGDAGPFALANSEGTLGYGKTWSGGGLSCASAFAGLTCTSSKSRHGFFLSRAAWRAF